MTYYVGLNIGSDREFDDLSEAIDFSESYQDYVTGIYRLSENGEQEYYLEDEEGNGSWNYHFHSDKHNFDFDYYGNIEDYASQADFVTEAEQELHLNVYGDGGLFTYDMIDDDLPF